jgi:hypothetical protein
MANGSKLGWLMGAVAGSAIALLAWQNHQLSDRIASLSNSVAPARESQPIPSPSLASCYLNPMFAKQLASELRGTLGSPPQGEPSSATQVAQSPSPPSTEALDNANHSLDDIVHRGRITPDDVNTLRSQLASATSEQRDQVRARIAAAINREELIPEDPHALYP